MIIGIDIDNVFLDTRYFESKVILDKKRRFDIQEYVKLIEDNLDSVIPCKNAVEATTLMYTLSKQPIVFVTGRDELMYNITLRSLDKIIGTKFRYKLVTVGNASKENAIKQYHITYYADDNVHYLLQTFKHLSKAFFVRSDKYKKDPNFGKIRNIVCVNDLIEMYEILSKKK